MLKRAILYKSQLTSLFANASDDISNRYFTERFWQFEREIDNSSWSKHQFVSVDKSENVIGLLEADINKPGHYISGLSIIRFLKNNRYSFTFSKDLRDFLLKLLLVYNYRKLEYSVAVGSPQEKWYDSYTMKYGGKIVGTFKEHFTTESGTVIDLKLYELFRIDFIRIYQELHNKHYQAFLFKGSPNEKEILV